jgi:hypothetical protein
MPLSIKVMTAVWATTLPRNMRRRPAAKLVLMQLADRANDDGMNAWPAVATVARECELGTRTVEAILKDLRANGFIAEQAKPRYHRPRTWRIVVSALVDPHDRAGLARSPARSCDPSASSGAGGAPHGRVQGPQPHTQEPQNRTTGSQDLADDPSVHPSDDPIIDPKNSGAAPRSTKTTKKREHPESYPVLVKLAHEVIDTNPGGVFPDQLEDLKIRAARLHIPYDSSQAGAALFSALHQAQLKNPTSRRQ